jgi:hypothetical protein
LAKKEDKNVHENGIFIQLGLNFIVKEGIAEQVKELHHQLLHLPV